MVFRLAALRGWANLLSVLESVFSLKRKCDLHLHGGLGSCGRCDFLLMMALAWCSTPNLATSPSEVRPHTIVPQLVNDDYGKDVSLSPLTCPAVYTIRLMMSRSFVVASLSVLVGFTTHPSASCSPTASKRTSADLSPHYHSKSSFAFTHSYHGRSRDVSIRDGPTNSNGRRTSFQ
jgi:hypothetical protein